MFYCYYPCGGLLIRATRWGRTLHGGHSTYISEDADHDAYGEDRTYLRNLDTPRSEESVRLIDSTLRLNRKRMSRLDAVRAQNGRPTNGPRLELQHQPFMVCLEGSRGCQGIMQMYFNLKTIGFEGYQSLLEWTYLLTRRCEEAVSMGRIDVRPVTEWQLDTKDMRASAKDQSMHIRNASRDSSSIDWTKTSRIVPVLGGRLLRLSAGSCNQLLVTYVPRDIAILISTFNLEDWEFKMQEGASGKPDAARPGHTRFWRTMHYLWRVNEHLWFKYLYANPSFGYYVGHTEMEPLLPASVRYERNNATKDCKKAEKPEMLSSDVQYRRDAIASLLAEWNVWTRWKKRIIAEREPEVWECPFFNAMANRIQDPSAPRGEVQNIEGRVRFFAHKIVVMHPYTDESILSDLLGKMMFWGERSAEAVRFADAACANWLAH